MQPGELVACPAHINPGRRRPVSHMHRAKVIMGIFAFTTTIAMAPIANACVVTLLTPADQATVSGVVSVTTSVSACDGYDYKLMTFNQKAGYYNEIGFGGTSVQWDSSSVPAGISRVELQIAPYINSKETTASNIHTVTLSGSGSSGSGSGSGTGGSGASGSGSGSGSGGSGGSSSGPQPYGSISPPSGKHWQVVYDDEFNQDSSINQALWNGGPDGYPLCHTPGIASNNNGEGCGWAPGNSTFTMQDCLGYGGGPKGNECVNVFSGSDFVTGQSFYNSISPGTGLAIMSANDPSDPAGNNYFDSTWTGLQNYGKFSLHPGAFVEWYAKMPTNVHGEGNGLHTDLWCTANSRTTLGSSSNNVEVDVNEKNPSTSNRNSTTFDVAEGAHAQVGSYGAPGGALLDTGFHRYAAQWYASGGSGSWQIYADGSAVSGVMGTSASGWQSGLYCFAGWMQEGRGLNGGTSTNNPLIVQYFRAWQAE